MHLGAYIKPIFCASVCVFVWVSQVETNVKLEECLNKVQQENEDYKARMDKHAALSKYVPLLLSLSQFYLTSDFSLIIGITLTHYL